MDNNEPRHARQPRKRHQIERADPIGLVIAALSLLVGLAALVLSAVNGPSAEHAVAPGPVIICIAVYAPAYCPAAASRSTSP